MCATGTHFLTTVSVSWRQSTVDTHFPLVHMVLECIWRRNRRKKGRIFLVSLTEYLEIMVLVRREVRTILKANWKFKIILALRF